MIRLLYLHNSPARGGARTANERVTKFLRERHHDLAIEVRIVNLSLIAMRVGGIRDVVSFVLHRLLSAFVSRKLSSSLSYIGSGARIERFFLRFKPDLIVASYGDSDLIGIQQILDLDVPKVFVQHDFWFTHFPFRVPVRDNTSSRLVRAIAHRETKLSTLVTEFMKTDESTHLLAFSPKRWDDLAKVFPASRLHQLTIPQAPLGERPPAAKLSYDRKNVFRVGFGYAWASEAENKGHRVVRGIIRTLRNRSPRVNTYEFVFFGGAKVPRVVKAGNGVLLSEVGQINPEEMPSFLESLDCLLFPSLNDSYGLLVEESLRVGTPALVSTGAGASHLIQSSSLGIVLDDFDPKNWVNALEYYADNTFSVKVPRVESGAGPEVEKSINEWKAMLSKIVGNLPA